MAKTISSILSPSLSFVRFYTEPIDFKVTAANGVNTATYTLKIDYEEFITEISELIDINLVAEGEKTFYAKGRFGTERRSTKVTLKNVNNGVEHEVKTYFFEDGEPDNTFYCKRLEIGIPSAIPAGVYELQVACYNSKPTKAEQKITIP